MSTSKDVETNDKAGINNEAIIVKSNKKKDN